MRLITVLVGGAKRAAEFRFLPLEGPTTVLLNSEQLFSPADVLCMKSSSVRDPVLSVISANPRVKHCTRQTFGDLIYRALLEHIH